MSLNSILNLPGRLLTEATFPFIQHGLWRYQPPFYCGLFGGPGSGKGGLAKVLGPRLKDVLGYAIPHCSTGDCFRAEINSGSALGRKVAPILEKGDLVEDEITISVMRQQLKRWRHRRGVVIDGMPRTYEQADLLDGVMDDWEVDMDFLFYLDGPPADLRVRLIGRRVCSNEKCGAIYHVDFDPPKVKDKCNLCKSPLFQRKDDKPEVIDPRIEKFIATKDTILDYYKQSGRLFVIPTNNTQPKGKVVETALEIIRSRWVKA